MSAHELGAAQPQPGVEAVPVPGLGRVIGDDQRFGQAEGPAELPAHLERVEVVGVQVDRNQPDPAGPVQHPPDGRP